MKETTCNPQVLSLDQLYHLIAQPNIHTYLVLDSIRIPDLLSECYKQESPIMEQLYKGTAFEPLLDISPIILEVSPENPVFTRWLTEPEYSSSGILIQSNENLDAVIQHLQHIMQITPPQGLPRLFRFYSPRIFSRWVDILAPIELERFSGPISRFAWHTPDQPDTNPQEIKSVELQPASHIPSYSSPWFSISTEIEQEVDKLFR